MDKDQINVKEFMLAVGQEVKDNIEIPNADVRALRVKLLLEEVLELAEASGVSLILPNPQDLIGQRTIKIENFVFFDRGLDEVDIVKVADAFGDIDYVTNGGGNAYGIDLEPVKEEVHRSNMSKLTDGHTGEDGKWVKGPSYSPANIKKVLNNQKKV